jgi:hypothetical protein
LFSAASGITNLLYGIAKGTDLGTSLVWGAVSIAVSVVFVLSWPALLVSIDRRQWMRATMALIALVITGTYSVSAALGSAMGGRTSAAIEAKDAQDRKAKAQAAWEAARQELDQLAIAKPATELNSLIANANAELAKLPITHSVAEIDATLKAARRESRRYGCAVVIGSSAVSCPKLDSDRVRAVQRERLTASIAGWTADITQADERRAAQREKAKAAMDTAAAELAKGGPAKVANSDAAALAMYLQALGLTMDTDTVNKLLVLLAVLVIECGGGLALAVGMALSEGAGRSSQPERAVGQGERSLSERPNDALNASPERSRQFRSHIGDIAHSPALNERPAGSSHERVLSALRAKEGVLFGSQGALGAAFEWSKTRMNEVLHELQAAGRVRLSVSRQGTAVRLVGSAG